MGFVKITGKAIDRCLGEFGRQYLVGNLKKPQALPFVFSSELEVGITFYNNCANEMPHWHPIQKEYQFVLSGRTEYIDSLTGDTYVFSEGDFYFIEPKTCYSQRSAAGTKILFIKTPSIDDKIACANCDRVCNNRRDEFCGYKEIK